MRSATITRHHVATGMTVRQLCDAAVPHSDGTAGNLLLRDLGGPARLTAYLRGIGHVQQTHRGRPHDEALRTGPYLVINDCVSGPSSK